MFGGEKPTMMMKEIWRPLLRFRSLEAGWQKRPRAILLTPCHRQPAVIEIAHLRDQQSSDSYTLTEPGLSVFCHCKGAKKLFFFRSLAQEKRASDKNPTSENSAILFYCLLQQQPGWIAAGTDYNFATRRWSNCSLQQALMKICSLFSDSQAVNRK